MESKVFQLGNYVYECKASTGDIGGSIELSSLKPEIDQVKRRWAKEATMPSGYYYVFPVNYVTNETRKCLDKFKEEYRGEVDIDYFDCEQVQRLVRSLEKMKDMESLVKYIKETGQI